MGNLEQHKGYEAEWQLSHLPALDRVRQTGLMVEMSDEVFDDVVSDALDLIPEQLAAMMDNVVVLVEDEPPPEAPDLLGLYEGTPLTERDSAWEMGSLPDAIFIYRGPLRRLCESPDELTEQIAVTVIHEIAHHFGFDDAALHAMGWD